MKHLAIRLSAAVLACAFFAGSAHARVAPQPKPDIADQTAPIDRILNGKDIALYRDIFALQADGKWSAADRKINQLSNKILLGHVRYQRLMHPTAYRASYKELKAWLGRYYDHPSADRLYKLALRRRGKASYPKRPERIKRKGRVQQDVAEFKDRRSQLSLRRDIYRDIRADRLTIAGKKIQSGYAKGKLSHADVGRLSESLNRAWVAWGNPQKGLAALSAAAPIARPARITTDWRAGLAAWALGDFDLAAQHFEAVALYGSKDRSLAAAGGVWASRAFMRANLPAYASKPLRAAQSEAPESFYGILAAKQLGVELARDWSIPRFTAAHWDTIKNMPGIKRALALSQVGQSDRADAEVLRSWYAAKNTLYGPLLAFAHQLDLPQSQVRMGDTAPKGYNAPLMSRYPIPSWQPQDGFQADPALLFALIRQESRFAIRARSSSGARGLMQVMPRTAGYIGKDRKLVRDRDNLLYDPEFNMSLGQRYVNYLKTHKATDGDLLYLLAAYNGGPGNVNKWRRKLDTKDPLWFIEHMPLRETRKYVEYVAANYWIYRQAMGLETKTLERLATGEWPGLEVEHQATATLVGQDPAF